jgi:hypothetical protein
MGTIGSLQFTKNCYENNSSKIGDIYTLIIYSQNTGVGCSIPKIEYSGLAIPE